MLGISQRHVSQIQKMFQLQPGNTKGGRMAVPLTSFFDWFGISSMTTDNLCFYLQNRPKPVKQEVNCTVILPPLAFPVCNWTGQLCLPQLSTF